MVVFQYNLRCRQCLSTDSIEHNLSLTSEEALHYRNEFYNKTEYGVKRMLENMYRYDSNCAYCNSRNVEPSDIGINNKKLYDPRNLQGYGINYFIIKLNKLGEGIQINTQGSKYLKPMFFDPCMQIIFRVLDGMPDSMYTSLSEGDFFVCVSGGYNNKDEFITRIEQLSHAGISKVEIKQCMDSVFESTFKNNQTYIDYKNNKNK